MSVYHAKDEFQGKRSEFSIRIAILGIFVLALVTLITILSLQPLNPAVMQVIFMYVFVFLGAGLFVAAIINRFIEKKNSEEPS